MTATFQKTIYKALEEITSYFAFLDDILEIQTSKFSEHKGELDQIIKKQ